MASWPPSWVAAYQRFQSFIAARKQFFPQSELVLDQQSIAHVVKWPSTLTERLRLEVYKNGICIFETSADRGALDQDTLRMYGPGLVYTAVIKSCGGLGYQFLYPFVWFETEDVSKTDYSRRIRVVDPRKPLENYWPNERLFLFRDFNVLPHNHISDFLKANNKVSPAVTLHVTNEGVIKREALPPEYEKHLVWRIYRGSELIEKGSASGQLRHQSGREWGNYVAFVGVEGPEGFMPVSNMLAFPLFPAGGGKLTILPTTSQVAGVPDFLIGLLNEEQLNSLREEQQKAPDHRYVEGRYVYFSMPTAQDRWLVELWAAWVHTLQWYKERNYLWLGIVED